MESLPVGPAKVKHDPCRCCPAGPRIGSAAFVSPASVGLIRPLAATHGHAAARTIWLAKKQQISDALGWSGAASLYRSHCAPALRTAEKKRLSLVASNLPSVRTP